MEEWFYEVPQTSTSGAIIQDKLVQNRSSLEKDIIYDQISMNFYSKNSDRIKLMFFLEPKTTISKQDIKTEINLESADT